jgi:AcrR family transcriptional regulator
LTGTSPTVAREDRRVRRTRAALRRALIELINEQGYASVSVDAIAVRADVTRATFYAHYGAKPELLAAVVDEFADRVIEAFDDSDVTSRPAGRMEVLLEQARESRDVLGLIVRGEGDGEPLRRFTERVEAVLTAEIAQRCAAAGVEPRSDPRLIAAMRAAEVVAAVAWFLESDGRRPREVALAANEIADNGWLWAAGLRPDLG